MKQTLVNVLTLTVTLAGAIMWNLAVPCQCLADKTGVQELVRAHADGLGMIKTIVVDFETRRRPRGSANDGEESGEATHVWTWKADFVAGKQRIRVRNLLLKDDEFGPRGLYDLVVYPDMRYRLLENWDSESPTPMNATFVGNVSGDIGVTDGTIPNGLDPRATLLWLVNANPSMSLSDAVASSPGASREKAERVDGHLCEVIEIPSGMNDGNAWKYKMYLDGAANYMIRKARSQSTPIEVRGISTPVTVIVDAYVTGFENPAENVYVPSQVVIERSDSNFVTEHIFKHYEVNEVIPDEEFELVFPKWTRVRDMQTGVTQVMDGSGGILGQFSGAEGFRDWEHSMGKGESVWTTPRIVTMIVILVVILVILWRLRQASQN